MSTAPAKNSSRGSSAATGLACAVIVFAALAVYHNSFSGPFIFDDAWSITTNSSIHHFAGALSPPPEKGVGGRPILNLTFALNYALGGMNAWGYHAVNLIIHALAGLTLFGIIRRTLLRPVLSGRFGMESVPLALAVAVIWAVHPLQTEAVTYISQRAESLMGLFYLLTLYCFVRGVENRSQPLWIQSQESRGTPALNSQLSTPSSRLWLVASLLSCLLGAMTKEIIVTAPVMVLLYDRTFVAGSLREAWRLRWRYYLGLAGTWLPLACLMTGLSQRSVGFDQGVTWWSYGLTSCRSVVLYLELAIWPHPLVLDYGISVVPPVSEIVPYALVLAALLAGTAIALRRWPATGFAGAWIFVILAPASSVIPVAGQPMAEHRMYLSLAAVAALVVLGLYRWIGRRSFMVLGAVAIGLGRLGIQRNKDYRSELAIWSDTVAKCPDNARAYNNLGSVLAASPGQLTDAISDYKAALRINPDYAEAFYNLGKAQAEIPGQLPQAISAYEAALRINPDYAEAHNNLGSVLLNIPDRLSEAVKHFETALRINPDLAAAHNNLGSALANTPGRLPQAIGQFETAVRLDPDYAEAHNNLGLALAKTGRNSEAISQFEEAVRIKPEYPEAHYNLGTSLGQIGRIPEAITQLEDAVRINPDYAEAHKNLGLALYQAGQIPAAMAQCQEVLRIKPDSAEARAFLEKLQKAAR